MARAELIADGGAAAVSADDFFRSREFLAAEAATHTIVLERSGGSIALPVIVREIEESGERDAISPYGYPGATIRGGASAEVPPAPADVDWSATGLVTLFVRDRIASLPALAGGTERAEVMLCDPARPSGVRKRLREQIRRNERRGWSVSAYDPPRSGERLEAFTLCYRETMERAGAEERYLFSRDYLGAVLSTGLSTLLIAERDGVPGAAAIAVRSDGLLHYFLGGTANAAMKDSPMKNVFAAMIELATREGAPLHLGGGVERGDSLEGFKRGFANRTERFVTHEVVCDEQAYRSLSGPAEPGEGFFPAYRASP